jgi:hypothetical protein
MIGNGHDHQDRGDGPRLVFLILDGAGRFCHLPCLRSGVRWLGLRPPPPIHCPRPWNRPH